MPKPKLKLASLLLLAEIDSYIRRYDCRGSDLPDAASDVLDGGVNRNEVEELIRRRLLSVVRFDDGEVEGTLCGSEWTVELTPKAMRTFWPDRTGSPRG